MEQVIEATRTAHGYLVSPLSENISETPEGFLVVVGCPVARTGWQEYLVKDLPRQSAEELGVNMSNPGASIDLYRPQDEVFDSAFLASLNGKPITDGHPAEFVNPENFNQYSKGHVQNVRRGERMEDGEWPVVADLVISGEPLISKVRNRQSRQVSLGYDFGIARDGQKIVQCDMLANHAAIVPKGRAGDLIAIKDAAPAGELETTAEAAATWPPPAPPAVERAATLQTSTAPPTKKEIKPVANILKHLLGLGLKTYAVDAEPEALATAAEAVYQKPPAATRARAADAEEEGLEEEPAEDKRVKDKRKSRDDDPAITAPEDHDREPAMDAGRKRMHDALDRVAAGADRRTRDADIEGLKALLDEYFSEEEEEPEHAVEDGMAELEGALGEGPAEDCECGEPGCPVCDARKARDEEELDPSGEEELEPMGADSARAMDGRARARARVGDAAAATQALLKIFRPYVARSRDSALKHTFNDALSTVKRSSRASSGGYGAFARNSRARDRAPRNPNPDRARTGDGHSGAGTDRLAKLQAAYDAALKGGK